MFKDKITKEDIISIIKFLVVFPIAILGKLLLKDIWLISERPHEARDNGFYLFEYINREKNKKNVYYIIEKDCIDYNKVKKLGSIIHYKSLKHYLFYLMAKIHISAHIDGGMPNRRVCNFLERKRILKNKKVFLQHGITKDLIEFAFYKNARIDLFVCAAKSEYEFVRRNFGYPSENVKLLGFCRFDKLSNCVKKNQILIMPTWRSWLAKNNFDSIETARKYFYQSEYYKKYLELLNNRYLHQILEENNIDLIFYPHSDMQDFVDLFQVNFDKVIIGNASEYDVQTLLKESAVLITDYSSVAFDFAYMNKPIFYYQFDYEMFREKQHRPGYYEYSKDAFGSIHKNIETLIYDLERKVKDDFIIDQEYQEKINNFFTLKDKENCERNYLEIKKIQENINEL